MKKILIIKDPRFWAEGHLHRAWVGFGNYELYLEEDKYFFKTIPDVYVHKDRINLMIKAELIEVLNADNNDLVDTGEDQ